MLKDFIPLFPRSIELFEQVKKIFEKNLTSCFFYNRHFLVAINFFLIWCVGLSSDLSE